MSSSLSGESTEEETEDELPVNHRGRDLTQTKPRSRHLRQSNSRQFSPRRVPSELPGEARKPGHDPFTRSRSPAVKANTQTSSPAVARFSRQKTPTMPFRTILPALVEIHIPLPLSKWSWSLCIDSRRAGESLLVLASFIYATLKLANIPDPPSYLSPSNLSGKSFRQLMTTTRLFAQKCIYSASPLSCILYGRIIRFPD